LSGTIRLPEFLFDISSKLAQVINGLTIGHLQNHTPRLLKATQQLRSIIRGSTSVQ